MTEIKPTMSTNWRKPSVWEIFPPLGPQNETAPACPPKRWYWLLLVISAILFIVGLALLIHMGRRPRQQEEGKIPPGKPNILFIMLDDLGFNDVSWNNVNVHMPVMDKLAKEGVILDRSYAHAVCTPSRAEFLTGKYAHRLGIQHFVLEPHQATYLKLDEKTLAQSLKDIGYSTHLLGKWHLGSCRKEAMPTSRGFDTFYGTLGGALDSYTKCYSTRFLNDTAYGWWDNEDMDTAGQGVHVTDMMRQRAMSIIEETDVSQPSFMFLSFPAPHTPVQSPLKYKRHYENRENSWRAEYLGMVSHVDDALGDIIQALKDKGIYDNTIIVMTSDNGGDGGASSNFPLRGAKGSTYEGGTRVPTFISGPAFKKHGYISKERFHITDWYPTFMKLAGSQNFNGTDLDGVDQSRMLTSGVPTERREVLYGLDTAEQWSTGHATISYDNFKLILQSPGFADGWDQDKTVGWIGPGGVINEIKRISRWSSVVSDRCPPTREMPYNWTMLGLSNLYASTAFTDAAALYDIEADPSEKTNLASIMPAKVDELKNRLKRHFAQELVKSSEAFSTYYTISQKDNEWSTNWCQNM